MQPPKPELRSPPRSDHRSQSTGDAAVAARAREGVKLSVRSGGPVLTSEQSAILRERLLGQLVAIDSTDEAVAWARQNLSTKNTLTADDARIVEAKFQAKLSTIGDGEGASEARNAVSVQKCPSVGLMRPLAENFRRGLVTLLRRAQSASWAKRFACAIRSTGSSCPGRRALYAAGRRRIRITSRLCNLVPSDTESAMSSPCRFVGSTTVSFIARATRPRGGARSTLILFQSRSGSGSTRGSMATNSRQQAKASRRRRVRRSWTCQFKVELVRTTMRAPMWRAPFPKTPTHLRADDLGSRLIKCAEAEPRQGLKMLGNPCQSVIRPPLPQGLVGLMSFDPRTYLKIADCCRSDINDE